MNKSKYFDIEINSKSKYSLGKNKITSEITTTFEPGVALHLLNTTRNIWALVVFSGVFAMILFGRMIQLQLIHGNDYRLRSDINRVRTVSVAAPRGAILDRDGNSLAENIPNITLTITPADLPNSKEERDNLLLHIASLASVPIADITSTLNTKQRRSTDPIVIREMLSYDEAIHDLIVLADVPAVTVVSLPNRSYPTGAQTAGILGYIGRISPAQLLKQPQLDPLTTIGITGLEYTYNEVLTGINGVTRVERDAQNREQRVLAQQEATPGQTIITTIDNALQKQLTERLNNAVESMKTSGGAAIVLDPRTGEVLALTSAPVYDNNIFVSSNKSQEINRLLTNPRKPLLNRAISGQYPSGSIVKPFLAAAALSEHLITRSTTIMSVGGFKVGNDYFPDWKNGGHGKTDVIKAIAESVNTFFYAIGGGLDGITGLGVDRIVAYLQKFGWGSPTGIDIPAEADGFLPTKEWRTNDRPSPWKLGDTYHLAIGQGDLEVTPVQIISAIASIANGGTLYKPFLVKEIHQSDGLVTKRTTPQIITKQVVQKNVITTVQAGMRESVLNGSSRLLQSLPVTSAGKTGTAQFGNQGKTHAWFSAFAPYENPSIAIVVLIENGGEGNATALPVARDVLQWYFTHGAGRTL